MIIGISGTFGSGKDLAAEYLESKGFQHISLADILREEATKRGLDHNRETLRTLSNEISEWEGGDKFAKVAISRKKNDNLVLSAVRKIGEVDYLKTFPDFKMLFIDAPLEIRYERLVSRSRAGENKMTLEELKQKEELEMSGKSSQRVDYCKKEADVIISNTGTVQEFYGKIDKILVDGVAK